MFRCLAFLFLLSVAHNTQADLSFRDAIVQVKVPLADGAVAQLSAVCVDRSGVFLSAGHGQYTKGSTYEASRSEFEDRTFTLECVEDRPMKDDKGEGVVVLRSTDPDARFMACPIGNVPDPGDMVYGIGYAGGRFTYTEGMLTARVARVPNPTNGDNLRWLECDFRMLNGASGGGLFNAKNELVGILSSRSLLGSERRSDGTFKQDPPSTSWFSSHVFLPVVKPYLKTE